MEGEARWKFLFFRLSFLIKNIFNRIAKLKKSNGIFKIYLVTLAQVVYKIQKSKLTFLLACDTC